MGIDEIPDSKIDISTGILSVGHGVRGTAYFMSDQNRLTDITAEYRSIQNAISRSGGFNIAKRNFQFIPVSEG